jgi:hypothetical protein
MIGLSNYPQRVIRNRPGSPLVATGGRNLLSYAGTSPKKFMPLYMKSKSA